MQDCSMLTDTWFGTESLVKRMTDNIVMDPEDLEDGEIESDSEVQTEQVNAVPETTTIKPDPIKVITPVTVEKLSKQKEPQKKKKEYQHYENRGKMAREKFGRRHEFSHPIEDDIALNIEKALRKVLNKGEQSPKLDKTESGGVDEAGRKKTKKRKKREHLEKDNKKKRKHEKSTDDNPEEMDEDEMMCIRGASPVQKEPKSSSPINSYLSDERDTYGSDASSPSRDQRSRFPRRRRDFPERKGKNARRRDGHSLQDPDGVCLYYMQGKCHRGDDCIYSHNAQPPRKMELCKFYLMDCCAKRDKCLYMHSDFPCKYYHTGLPCIFKDEDCKFAHGKPLPDQLKTILLKHIETAPNEILGEFPRLSKDSAVLMLATTQTKLQIQYSAENGETKEKTIPSIFELNIPKPAGLDEKHIDKTFQNNIDRHNKTSKVRHTRWCDVNQSMMNIPPGINYTPAQSILDIQNLNNVLTPPLIAKLQALGIEDFNQLNQLTVMQLNQIGLTMSQINEIQLNTLNIQKLGLINSDPSLTENPLNPNMNTINSSKDLDMRIAPNPITDVSTSTSKVLNSNIGGKDVDMRYAASPKPTATVKEQTEGHKHNIKSSKDSIDIDQYAQDALKFGTNDGENCDIYGTENFIFNESESQEKPLNKDVDHRVIPYADEVSSLNTDQNSADNLLSKSHSDVDTRIRISAPQVQVPMTDKIIRRSTTDDDDDNNLQIDEKWYSSDEEQTGPTSAANESVKQDTKESTPPPVTTPALEPSSVLNQLGDLSKINITVEVTRLLSSLKNNAGGINDLIPHLNKDQLKPRDPRAFPKKSPEHKSASTEPPKSFSVRKSRISIYECLDGEVTDDRKRSDVDLRQPNDHDFRISTFGDTDLRQTPGSGDIDLRLALPFKAIPNYTPATEINGSIASHPPILYKLYGVDIPRPNYADIKNSTLKSQAASDPRLRKIFRLSVDESPAEPDKFKPLVSIRADPRTRRKDSGDGPEPTKATSLDLQVVIQTSNWYKELGTNNKILVNQQLAAVSSSLKKFHLEKTPGKTYDLSTIHSNSLLLSIFSNLGISLDEMGNFSYLSSQENTIANQMNFGLGDSFMGLPMEGMNMMGMNSGGMGPGNIANMGAMPMNNMGPIGNVQGMGFDPRFTSKNSRPTPGLLGIAPNIPHNFDSGAFNGMQNFSMDNNFGNNVNSYNSMTPNGSMNDFSGNTNEFSGNDGESFFRNKNKDFTRGGGFRNSRGSERRGRGSSNRGGGRERRNYSDRGSWKNDRR